MVGKYFSVEDSAKLYGVKPGGMYKWIDKYPDLATKEMVNKQVEVRVNPVELLKHVLVKKNKLQKQVEYLLMSEKLLRRHVDG